MAFEYLLIVVCAFSASFISFYSGFGLGTILMPIMAIFLPLPIAIGFTAIIHLIHNLLRTGLLWKHIDWRIILRFGSSALAAVIPGALLLKALSTIQPFKKYTFFSIPAELSILHIAIGLLLILFAALETFPHRAFKMKSLVLGGFISGFFGGLSGNQGAFRSIFLMHSNMSKQSFIATSAFISVLVDLVRLAIYALSFTQLLEASNKSILASAIGGAMLGIVSGALLLPKITIDSIRKLIVLLLYLFGFLLIAGII